MTKTDPGSRIQIRFLANILTQNFQPHLGFEKFPRPSSHPASFSHQTPNFFGRPDVEIAAKLGAFFLDLLVDELFLRNQAVFRDGKL